MKNTTGLYKHQRDNRGSRRRLPEYGKDYVLVPVTTYEYERALEMEKAPYSARLQQDLIEAMESLQDLLPLAEAYLKQAPGHPDNAKLETARAILSNFGPSTGESATVSRQHAEGPLRLTVGQREALREAATFRLSGEMEEEHYRVQLERALEKL